MQSERESRKSSAYEGATRFPYSASDEKLARLRENYGKLELGIGREAVRGILGAPDVERRSSDKRGRKLGWTMKYYIFKRERQFVNEVHDRVLHLYFDEQDRLTWVAPQHLDDFGEIGSPPSR